MKAKKIVRISRQGITRWMLFFLVSKNEGELLKKAQCKRVSSKSKVSLTFDGYIGENLIE